MFDSVKTIFGGWTTAAVLVCLGVSLAIGIAIAVVYRLTGNRNRSMAMTLALLPAMVQSIIMLVNGNLGIAFTVCGAFALVRFRSNPGSARDISYIFFSVCCGLACGMGYVIYAAVFSVIMAVVMVILSFVSLTAIRDTEKRLKIAIPETLEFEGVFDDLFEKYLKKYHCDKVRTANMGSIYELSYVVVFKDDSQMKEFIDQVRCRNGNLAISIGENVARAEDL